MNYHINDEYIMAMETIIKNISNKMELPASRILEILSRDNVQEDIADLIQDECHWDEVTDELGEND